MEGFRGLGFRGLGFRGLGFWDFFQISELLCVIRSLLSGFGVFACKASGGLGKLRKFKQEQ